jgi:hypothetical protein
MVVCEFDRLVFVSVFVSVLFETGSCYATLYVNQADFQVGILLPSSPSSGIIGMNHHAWFHMLVFK